MVSQFTLHGKLKGNRPTFHGSMPGDAASDFFDRFVLAVSKEYGSSDNVATGLFGKKMEVSIVNDGPVTIFLDSQEIGFKRRIKPEKKD